jgi:hypothetical protein
MPLQATVKAKNSSFLSRPSGRNSPLDYPQILPQTQKMKHNSVSCGWRSRRLLVCLGLLLVASLDVLGDEHQSTTLASIDSATAALEVYRSTLNGFRSGFGGGHDLPDVPFFQFGMGL